MDQNHSSGSPLPADDYSQWETYFRCAVESGSSCKVRVSHLQQTPRQREQVYLKQLAKNAQSLLPKKSLSGEGHTLQRQVLELIKLRRRFAPDDSAILQQSQVFLAIVQMHQAIEKLLDRISFLLQLHSDLEQPMNEIIKFTKLLCEGKVKESRAIFPLLHVIQNRVANSNITTEDWLRLSFEITNNESEEPQTIRRIALANALQCSYLATQIFRRQAAEHHLSEPKKTAGKTSLLQSFGLQSDSFLIACLLKDVGLWLYKNNRKSSLQANHAELSASLVSGLSGLQVRVVQLIRQHHECIDGSGLPLRIRQSKLHAESRLLGVLTRWSELFNSELRRLENSNIQAKTATVIESVSDILLQETHQHRWEKLSTDLLLDAIGIQPLTKQERPRFQSDTKPSWRIPRPHFLNTTRQVIPVSTIRKKRTSSQ